MQETVGPSDGKRPGTSGPFRLSATRYKPIFEARRSYRGATLVMWFKRGAEEGRRAGVVVSKRTFHHAVDRNRAKRLLRESFRLLRSHLAGDVEVILVARAGIARRSCRQVMDDLARVCRKCSIWLDEPPGQG